MKATGVVRRIDELGRIVVPKEIRRNMRIREGDSLEIFIDGTESIILKKYSQVESIYSFLAQYVDAIYSSTKKEIIVTDTQTVIAAAGSFRKDIVGKRIDLRLDDKIQKRTTQTFERGSNLEVSDNFVITKAAILKPIAVYGDIIGCVIIIGDNFIDDTEKLLADATSAFIGKALEDWWSTSIFFVCWQFSK